MYSNYTLINNSFLERLSNKKREELSNTVYHLYISMGSKTSEKMKIENYFSRTKNAKYKFAFFYCAHCNENGIVPCPFYGQAINEMKYCVSCGEPHIMVRFNDGYEKILRLILLSKVIAPEQNTKVCCDLNQQIIVLLLSTIEIYLRDFYITVLNMRYIKNGRTLNDRFKKDCKNDFQNADRANDRFKKELGINLRHTVGNEYYQLFKEFSAYRNVIVHNNGVCDRSFITKRIGNYEIHDNILISSDVLIKFAKQTKKAVDILSEEYHSIYMENTYNIIENY